MPQDKQLGPEALALVARRFRALSDPTRLAILQALFAGEQTVGELCQATGVAQANASKHLSLLAREGIVGRRKDGQFARYSISDDSIRALCELVCGSLAERFEQAREQLAG